MRAFLTTTRIFCTRLFVFALLLGVGCSTPKYLSRRIIKAPNQQGFSPSATVLKLWTNSLAAEKDPFIPFEVQVGPPEATLQGVELAPAIYNSQISSEFTDGGKGNRHLDVKFKFDFTSANRAIPERGTIFLLHGYMLSKEFMYLWAFVLAEEGYHVILIDLRGHGQSTGDTISFGKYESTDLEQVLDYLTQSGRCKGPIGVLGYSYGADLALHWMARDSRVRTAIAIAPYNRVPETLVRFAKEMQLPVSERAVEEGSKLAARALDLKWESWSAEKAIKELKRPVFFIGGGKDKIVPQNDLKGLQRRSPAGSSLLLIPEANHDAIGLWFESLREPIVDWLGRHLIGVAAEVY